MSDTPTIPERLRRLYRIELAAAGANTVLSNGTTGYDTQRLAKRAAIRANEERIDIEAAARERGIEQREPITRLREALAALRKAAGRQVLTTIALAAYRDAIAAPVDLPKSQFVEQRKHLRADLDSAEHAAHMAMQTALDIFNMPAEEA